MTLSNVHLAIMGTWLVSDAIYSLLLYLTAPGCEGVKRQTWARDHWVRIVRLLIGLILIGGAVA